MRNLVAEELEADGLWLWQRKLMLDVGRMLQHFHVMAEVEIYSTLVLRQLKLFQVLEAKQWIKNTIIRSVSGTANINGAHFQTNLCVGVDGIMASRQKLLICATAAYSTAGALLVHRDGRAYL